MKITRERIGPIREQLYNLNLNYELNSEDYIMENFAHFFHFNKKVTICRIDGKIVGWSCHRPEPHPDCSDIILAQLSVYVNLENRSKGIGKKLIQEELQYLKNKYSCVEFYSYHKVGNKTYRKAIKEIFKETYIQKSRVDPDWSVFYFSKRKRDNTKKIIKERNKI